MGTQPCCKPVPKCLILALVHGLPLQRQTQVCNGFEFIIAWQLSSELSMCTCELINVPPLLLLQDASHCWSLLAWKGILQSLSSCYWAAKVFRWWGEILRLLLSMAVRKRGKFLPVAGTLTDKTCYWWLKFCTFIMQCKTNKCTLFCNRNRCI
jgi:hypothetical protein